MFGMTVIALGPDFIVVGVATISSVDRAKTIETQEPGHLVEILFRVRDVPVDNKAVQLRASLGYPNLVLKDRGD